MLSVFLFCVHTLLTAQSDHKRTEETTDSTSYNITPQPENEPSLKQTDHIFEPLQTRACVNSYTNQTVSSYVSIAGCNTLAVQSVTVTSTGILSLSAPSEVNINGPFDVLLGGELTVGIETAPPLNPGLNYFYDEAGNRILRQSGATRSAANPETVNLHETAPLPEYVTDDSNNHTKK